MEKGKAPLIDIQSGTDRIGNLRYASTYEEIYFRGPKFLSNQP